MKKFISLFLCACLVLCVFTACSGDKDNDSAKNDTAQQLNITRDYHYFDMDEASVRSYEKLCNAVIAGESQVKFNTALSDNVNQLFYTSFPLNCLVDSLSFLEDKSGVSIKYVNDLETHKQLVEDFSNKVTEIVKSCNAGKVSSSRYVFNVYDYICKNMKIDESVMTAYDAIIKNAGSVNVINSVFEYLVLQGDGKACHAVNFDSTACVLSVAQVNKDWYYFSPATELLKNQGKALKYFGMSIDRVKTVFGVDNFKYSDQEDVEELPDKSFDKLKYSVEYTVSDSAITVDLGKEKMDLELQ